MKGSIIAVDFDGTCVSHAFPDVGFDIGAVPVLKELIKFEHKLILFTMRSDIESPKAWESEIIQKTGNYLTDALNWFKIHNIPLFGVNNNPSQHKWTSSPKAYAHYYIDDASIGCPIKFDSKISDRHFVDWEKLRILLLEIGLLR